MGKHIPRFYIENFDPETKNFLQQDKVAHLRNVLRAKTNSEIIVFNERVGEWKATVSISNEFHCLKKTNDFIDGNRISLCFGIIKQENLLLMLRKTTELGVTNLYPITTKYTNCDFINYEKCQKVLISAIEQCERLDIPKVHSVTTFEKFIKNIENNQTEWYSAVERLEQKSTFYNNCLEDCGFIIGPEGGFSIEEKNILLQKTKPIKLANTILKSETSAIACIALLAYFRALSQSTPFLSTS
jgi:16S rRNA (uracil1498-N3)-methyltransferase